MATIDNSEPEPVPAATVMLVRDADCGIEVFLLKRSARSDFASAYVFPGGVTGEADTDASLEQYCEGLSEVAAARILSVSAGALSYWVTAIRECFEESGILLARRGDGSRIARSDSAGQHRFAGYREALAEGSLSMSEFCEHENLVLECSLMHYVSFWTTPVDYPRRYSTRFFLAAVPCGQTGRFDGRETVDSLWISPGEALRPRKRRELNLHPPTIANLRALLAFESTAEATKGISTLRPEQIPEIVPKISRDPGGIKIDLQKIWHPPVVDVDD